MTVSIRRKLHRLYDEAARAYVASTAKELAEIMASIDQGLAVEGEW